MRVRCVLVPRKWTGQQGDSHPKASRFAANRARWAAMKNPITGKKMDGGEPEGNAAMIMTMLRQKDQCSLEPEGNSIS